VNKACICHKGTKAQGIHQVFVFLSVFMPWWQQMRKSMKALMSWWQQKMPNDIQMKGLRRQPE
jgi:chemotaxis regulatin CheY-phosphate phosphatase CheZ